MSFRPDAQFLAKQKAQMLQWQQEGKIKTHLIDTSSGVTKEREKKSKYGNVKTEVKGIEFDSGREARRYEDLYLLEKAGEISDLKRQVQFPLFVRGAKVCIYVADFTYQENGKLVVNDAKGLKTSVYSLKKKLMKACLGIEILES